MIESKIFLSKTFEQRALESILEREDYRLGEVMDLPAALARYHCRMTYGGDGYWLLYFDEYDADGELVYPEETILRALAPFVESSSYVDFCESGSNLGVRYFFSEGKVSAQDVLFNVECDVDSLITLFYTECNCAAIEGAHELGEGLCKNESLCSPFCGSCRRHCAVKISDEGIGWTQVDSHNSCHTERRVQSACCEADVYSSQEEAMEQRSPLTLKQCEDYV